MGVWASLEMSNQIGEQLPVEVAGFMSCKLFSNDCSQQHPVNSVAFTQMLANILKIIFYQLGQYKYAKTPEYQRCVIHLKFFLQRVYATSTAKTPVSPEP